MDIEQAWSSLGNVKSDLAAISENVDERYNLCY